MKATRLSIINALCIIGEVVCIICIPLLWVQLLCLLGVVIICIVWVIEVRDMQALIDACRRHLEMQGDEL